MNTKKVADLDHDETCLIEAVIASVVRPDNKKAFRVKLAGHPQTFYSQRAMNLYKAGDRLSMTIKASEFHETLYLWIEDVQKIQAEELPLETSRDERETKDGYDASDFAHGGAPERN